MSQDIFNGEDISAGFWENVKENLINGNSGALEEFISGFFKNGK